MSTKTTLALLAAFGVLALGFVVLRTRPPEAPAPSSAAATSMSAELSGTSRNLIEPKLGEVVKVVCKRKGEPDWVFEKAAKTGASSPINWKMIAPFEAEVPSYEVDRVGRQLKDLQYDIKYEPGKPGAVTPEQAGLNPPELLVTVTDEAGASATVEIGRPASTSETYVRLAGQEAVVVAKSNLRHLVKERAIEYRDLQLWNFPPEKVQRIEVEDRSDAKAAVTYVFTRDGSKWKMESPVAAKATNKVDELVRTINRLRATKWEDDRRERLAAYGLQPAAWTVRAIVEEEIPKEEKLKEAEGQEESPEGEEPEEEADAAPKTKRTVHELHISNQSPIGEDTKVYISVGDEAFVGSIMKTMADKFKPAVKDWRDMHVTAANVNEATRIEIATPEGSATLVKDLGKWKLEGQAEYAEDESVKALLKKIEDLTAVAFTDDEPADLKAVGLNPPQAEIRLTIPGAESQERIAVGGFSDPATKRLRYVRRNEVFNLAKVRAPDVELLMQNPRTYRDRTISNLIPTQFERLTLTIQDELASTPRTATFEHMDSDWKMSAPVSATVRKDRLDSLLSALASLRAEAIVADEAELSAYGLHDPAARVTITYKPPVEHRVEPKKEPEKAEEEPKSASKEPGEESPPKAEVVEVQPPSKELALIAAVHDGQHYVKRADRPTIYRVSPDFYNQLLAEYRTPEVLVFDDSKVTSFSIRAGDANHVFKKAGDKWTYVPEPDLPLDAAKVKNLLLQLKDLKTERYVRLGVEDLGAFGLDAPHREITVQREEAPDLSLLVSSRMAEKGPDKGYYAVLKGSRDVFLLTADTVKRFEVSLSELEPAR